LHKYAIQRRQAPQRVKLDSEQIERNKGMFDSTAQSIEMYHQQSQIKRDRARFANIHFCLQALPYLIFLILISAGIFFWVMLLIIGSWNFVVDESYK
jgi:hypothetical protein